MILEMIASLRKKIGDVSKSEKDVVAIPIAIAGKPNAGKSTLMNTIANQIVSHVSEKPGTTLDYLVTDVLLGKQLYRLYDTAGIRKHARASELEKIAWDKTYRMIDYIKPIVVVMIDMTESMSHMDLKIIGEMIEHKVPLVVVLSKVDLVTPKEQKQKMDIIIKYMEMAKWVPIVPLSSKTNIGISQLFGCIKKIFEQQNRRISTSALNKALGEAMIKSPPRFPKNKICKLYYMTQVDSNPPTFCCFINKLEKQNFAFSRWIDNTLRKNF
ncbi:MAG: GTP-binding protein [bacterium]